MKRSFPSLSIVLVLLCLTACSSHKSTSTIENVGESNYLSAIEFDSFETICSASNTIIKASYVGCEEFSSSQSIFKFKLKEDFTGHCEEDIIHVYESKLSSFIENKTYYLFLSGHRSALYPHVVYSRVCPKFLLGEDRNTSQYTFYSDFSLDVGAVSNFNEYIAETIIAGEVYITEPERLIHESIEDACDNADGIAIAIITGVEPVNKYVSLGQYEIETVLKGDMEGYAPDSRPVSSDSSEGDRVIFLYRYDTEANSYYMYKNENSVFTAESEEGQYIINLFSNIQ